ncbi:MAG: acetyl-CoA carboxylase, biotin carboxyl carrier protein [Rhodospirillaceae bacterium]|nr:acetyl-CoA carboxylase, biotin carboxyl carrier protein [Rhodospirillaceae bacterium]HAA91991.1 acetyl-CoA carboxylase biotin carboxyl carrier protein [Rhodospirillaceae bacterium]
MAKLNLDKELIRELNELLEETGLSEIEISEGRQSVRVSRQSAVATVAQSVPAAPAPATDTSESAESAEVLPVDSANDIPSPMVGTVYLSPKPGDPAFVSEGDQVSEGQTLMIVEAMKVMNPIPAPRAGTVTRILVTDAQPVEFGEPLLTIE